MCPQMSPFVLICPITRYFTAFLIPVTLQPKGIGQANQAPGVGSVPISANSNPSVGGFLFALANSKVCSKQLEILSAALNALPGQSRDNYRCSTTAAPIYRLEKTASSAQNKIFSRRIMSIFAKDSEIFQGNSSVFPVFSPKQEVPSNIYSKKA